MSKFLRTFQSDSAFLHPANNAGADLPRHTLHSVLSGQQLLLGGLQWYLLSTGRSHVFIRSNLSDLLHGGMHSMRVFFPHCVWNSQILVYFLLCLNDKKPDFH